MKLVNTSLMSKAEISEKRLNQGYLFACINYKDSIDFTLNSVEYYFVVDDSFSDVRLKKMLDDYRWKSKGNVYPYISGLEIKIDPKKEQIPVLKEYLSKYFQMISKGENHNGNFIRDITKTAEDLAYKDSSLLFYMFQSPYICNRSKFGFFYSIHKIRIEYYIELYPNFEAYEKDFLSSSNDLIDKKLVGIQGTRISAKLRKIEKYKNQYPVLLPISVVELK